MKLVTWRKMHGVSQIDMAKRIDVSPVTLYRYEEGSRRPRAEIAKRIEAATNGEVTAAELLDVQPTKTTNGVSEDAAPFTFAPHISNRSLLEEAASYGLDAADIAHRAVERAVKAERMKRFSEKNREAIESWNELVKREGLWSDGLRAF